jgi:hypothetical protein
MTKQKYELNHQERFEKLGMSKGTQGELVEAAKYVWEAPRDGGCSTVKKFTPEKCKWQTLYKS